MAKENWRPGAEPQKVKHGLTAFLYQGRTIVGVPEGTVSAHEFTEVRHACELKFQMQQDAQGRAGLVVSPLPVLPANEAITLMLPPCAHFDVSRDSQVISIWEALTGETSLEVAHGLPPLPPFRAR